MDPKILVDFAFFAGCKSSRDIGSPWNPRRLTTWTGFSAAVDMYLAVYPSIVLFQLHMSMKKKIG